MVTNAYNSHSTHVWEAEVVRSEFRVYLRYSLKKPKSRGLLSQGLLRVMLYISHLTDISVDFRGNFSLKARLRPNVLRPFCLYLQQHGRHASLPWGL